MDNFKKTIQNFNKQLSLNDVHFLNLEKIQRKNIDAIALVGMGGSGQIGDIILALRKELNIKLPVIVWKDWNLPKIPYKNPLYIFISHSGNTEETISGINLKKNKAVVTSGGKMLEMAKTRKLPAAYFTNSGIAPRQANGILLFAVIGLLKKYFSDIKINKFKIRPLETNAKIIAKKIKNKVIVLYSSSVNYYLSYNWKTRLNETSKAPAFIGIAPEICHNEIEIFENKNFKKQAIAVLLEDKNDVPVFKKRMEKLKKLFKLFNVKYNAVKIEGLNKFDGALNSLVLADWVSYYLAAERKINPAQTKLIDKLKNLK